MNSIRAPRGGRGAHAASPPPHTHKFLKKKMGREKRGNKRKEGRKEERGKRRKNAIKGKRREKT